MSVPRLTPSARVFVGDNTTRPIGDGLQPPFSLPSPPGARQLPTACRSRKGQKNLYYDSLHESANPGNSGRAKRTCNLVVAPPNKEWEVHARRLRIQRNPRSETVYGMYGRQTDPSVVAHHQHNDQKEMNTIHV